MARHTIDDVKVIHATSKAILIDSDELSEEWIPNAAVHNDSEVYQKGDEGTLTIHGWFAEKKGWI